MQLPPTISLDLYIDDSGMSGEGREKVVIDDMVHATTQVYDALVTDLECKISETKAAVVSSSKAAITALTARLGNLAGTQQPRHAAANLGIDYTAGKPLRIGGKQMKQKKR